MADTGHMTDGGQTVADGGHELTVVGQSDYRWLFLADAVTDLRVSERTVRRRVRAGELASRRAGDGRVEIGIPTPDGGHVTDGGRPVADTGQMTDGGQDVSGGGQAVTGDRQAALTELSARIVRLDEDKTHLREQLSVREQALHNATATHVATTGSMRADHDERIAELRVEAGLLVEATKARVIDLERELTVRDSTIADLTARLAQSAAAIVAKDGIIADKDGKAETLHQELRDAHAQAEATALEWARRADELSHRIANLVDRQQESESRIIELQPEAEKVPMLVADLGARDEELAGIRKDIEAIASRAVTGPVFRLLTKGKLRR
jgi:predicted  nucleic acid-binding Zn-ribbon protein